MPQPVRWDSLRVITSVTSEMAYMNDCKRALITGITGQDGGYLAELLLEKGYAVHGIKRRASSFNTTPNRSPVPGSPRTRSKVKTALRRSKRRKQPAKDHRASTTDEIYNLGAQSHVAVSFEAPEYTANVDALGTLRILEAVRICGLTKKTRVYQASTSELYGLVKESPQKETTPFHPAARME